MVSNKYLNEGIIMFKVGDLVYFKNMTELGILVEIVNRPIYAKYRVHFLETNFTWLYEEEELTKVA